jgi:hypothetical protein
MAKLDQLVRGEPLRDGGLLHQCIAAHRVDAREACLCDYGLDRAPVRGVRNTFHQAVPFQDIDDVGHRSRRHVHALSEGAQRQLAARAMAKSREHTKAAFRETVALGETLHRIVDPLRSQPQGGQRLENLDGTLASVLDHSTSHGRVIKVSGGVDREVSVRESSLGPHIGFPHSEGTHYSGGHGAWRLQNCLRTVPQLGRPQVNIALWVLQVLLGIFFVFHATVLLRPSPQRLQSGMRYVLEMPAGLRVFAGRRDSLE